VQLLRPLALRDALRRVGRPGAAQVPAGAERLDRHGGQRREGEAEVERREAHEGEHDGEPGEHELGDRVAARLRDGVDVARDAGDEVAGAVALDLLQLDPERAVDDVLAQVAEDPLAERGDAHHPEPLQRGLAQRGGEQRADEDVEVRGGAALHDDVDDPAEDRRAGEPGGRPREQDGEREERASAPLAQQRERGLARAGRRRGGEEPALGRAHDRTASR
jgi:hypothetical protein